MNHGNPLKNTDQIYLNTIVQKIELTGLFVRYSIYEQELRFEYARYGIRIYKIESRIK